MDHDRYAYSNLFKRKPVAWPDDARIALWIVPTLEFFPLDMAPQGRQATRRAWSDPSPTIGTTRCATTAIAVGFARSFGRWRHAG